MNLIVFLIGGFDVRWYGILIVIGMVIGMLMVSYNCKWREVDYDNLLNIVFFFILIGIIGVRLYYVVFEFENYKNNIMEVFNIRYGGFVIYGGFIFVIIIVLIYIKVKKFNFIKFVDVVVFFIIFV